MKDHRLCKRSLKTTNVFEEKGSNDLERFFCRSSERELYHMRERERVICVSGRVKGFFVYLFIFVYKFWYLKNKKDIIKIRKEIGK